MATERKALTCQGCNTVMEIDQPVPQIVNHETFSMLMIAHSAPVECPTCKAKYVYHLLGVAQVKTAWGRVQALPEDEPRVILAPGSTLN